MDFPYLAKIAKLNIAALAAIASAPPPPEPKVEGAVSTDTTIKWVGESGTVYRLWWRRTDANNWQYSFPASDRPTSFLMSTDGGPGGWQWTSKDNLLTCKGPVPYTTDDCVAVLKHIRVDDWVFGVSSVSKDGFESPVASAVPGGAFHPYIAPPKK
jgi:hypothetical protein